MGAAAENSDDDGPALGLAIAGLATGVVALLVALTALGLAIAAFCGRRGADAAAHGAAARAVDASAPRKGARPGVGAGGEAPDDVLAYAAARRAAATPAGGAGRPRALVGLKYKVRAYDSSCRGVIIRCL